MNLVKTVKEYGVDIAQLQKGDKKTLFARSYYNKPYDNENGFGETYGLHCQTLPAAIADDISALLSYEQIAG